MKFPSLSFEEFRHAATYMTLRSALWSEEALPTVDHLLVKWYVTEVLQCQDKAQMREQHVRFYGALQTLVEQHVFLVQKTSPRQLERDELSVVRVLTLRPGWWPHAFLELDARPHAQTA